MLNPSYALMAAVIWGFSPIYYRVFMRRFDFLTLNFVRTSLASAALLAPALYFGLNASLSYSLLSGLITLGAGDTMFLLSIREIGASVSTPVVYTYVLFVQLTAGLVGETVPLSNFLSAAMVIAGVYILSKGGDGRPRAKGILLALCAGLAWTAGQELVVVATSAGGNVFAVTFGRNLAGAAALGVAYLLTGRSKLWPVGVSLREFGFLALIAVSDLALGSLLLVYSISISGVALTVIVTSISPFLVQAFSTALGKEPPSRRDAVGGAVIVAALVLAVALGR